MDCVSRWWQFLVSRLVGILSCVLLVLLALFFAVMFSESTEKCIADLLGLKEKGEKFEILKFLGIGMGGILLALQAVASYKRAKAMEDTAKEQANAVLKTEQGQRQERLKNAIEHLGHPSDSVRLGGAYELFHLAQDTGELRQTVLDVLCAHIRQTTGESEYRETYISKPSEEIQSLLTLLFVQEHAVFKGLRANLQGSWLNGANLWKARLQGAEFHYTQMQGAMLSWAQLQGAGLWKAQLQGAKLNKAQLQGAVLSKAQLQGAELDSAQLQGAELALAQLQGAVLHEAQLQVAVLWKAQLQGAMLWRAQLQGAMLDEAQLQGAVLWRAQLQGAVLDEAQLQGVESSPSDFLKPFEDRIRRLIHQESDLSGVVFGGGLSRQDVDSLVQGFSDEKARGLLEMLTPHVKQKASPELPQNSGAVTGFYTQKEAEQWIAEYKQAMSKVPGAGDS